jgi:DNA-binding IclR family transcriptional regulator
VAAPIRDAGGQVAAAVHVSAHVSRGGPEQVLAEFLDPLPQNAKLIEEDLRIRG